MFPRPSNLPPPVGSGSFFKIYQTPPPEIPLPVQKGYGEQHPDRRRDGRTGPSSPTGADFGNSGCMGFGVWNESFSNPLVGISGRTNLCCKAIRELNSVNAVFKFQPFQIISFAISRVLSQSPREIRTDPSHSAPCVENVPCN